MYHPEIWMPSFQKSRHLFPLGYVERADNRQGDLSTENASRLAASPKGPTPPGQHMTHIQHESHSFRWRLPFIICWLMETLLDFQPTICVDFTRQIEQQFYILWIWLATTLNGEELVTDFLHLIESHLTPLVATGWHTSEVIIHSFNGLFFDRKMKIHST